MIRDLDPDNDYQYDKTNQPPRRIAKSALIQEMEYRAARCLRFMEHPNPALSGVCINCNGAKYAHKPHAFPDRVTA